MHPAQASPTAAHIASVAAVGRINSMLSVARRLVEDCGGDDTSGARIGPGATDDVAVRRVVQAGGSHGYDGFVLIRWIVIAGVSWVASTASIRSCDLARGGSRIATRRPGSHRRACSVDRSRYPPRSRLATTPTGGRAQGDGARGCAAVVLEGVTSVHGWLWPSPGVTERAGCSLTRADRRAEREALAQL